jgi:hypothetical protein
MDYHEFETAIKRWAEVEMGLTAEGGIVVDGVVDALPGPVEATALAAWVTKNLPVPAEDDEDAIEEWEDGPGADEFRRLLELLAGRFPGAFAGKHARLLSRGVMEPAMLYLGAGAKTRDELIARAGAEDDRYRRRLLLGCLAWIGDDVVVGRFAKWRAEPPERSDYVAVAALDAGWELTPEGTRRDLYSATCYALVRNPHGAGTPCGPVDVITGSDGQCRWCGRELTTLFDFDLRDSRLAWLGLTGERLRIPECDRCSGWAAIYTRVDDRGAAAWHPANRRPHFNGPDDGPWERLPSRKLAMAAEPRRSAFEAAGNVYARGNSQIGGFPPWLTGPGYVDCPDCGRPMVVVGTLHRADADEGYEGVTYAHLCAGCRVAATSYQQT